MQLRIIKFLCIETTPSWTSFYYINSANLSVFKENTVWCTYFIDYKGYIFIGDTENCV